MSVFFSGRWTYGHFFYIYDELCEFAHLSGARLCGLNSNGVWWRYETLLRQWKDDQQFVHTVTHPIPNGKHRILVMPRLFGTCFWNHLPATANHANVFWMWIRRVLPLAPPVLVGCERSLPYVNNVGGILPTLPMSARAGCWLPVCAANTGQGQGVGSLCTLTILVKG